MTTQTVTWQWLATPRRCHLFQKCTGTPTHLVIESTGPARGRLVTLCRVGVDTATGLSPISSDSPPVCKPCLLRWEKEAVRVTEPVPADAREWMERPFTDSKEKQ